MRFRFLVVALVAALSTPIEAVGAQFDSHFYGFWKLNVAKSDFGGGPPPKMGLVNWSEQGWVFSIVTADGGMYADGVATERGCTLIGVPDYSCTLQIVTPRHLRIVLRQGNAVRRVGDIELLADATTRAIHRVTPAEGDPYVESTIWDRAD